MKLLACDGTFAYSSYRGKEWVRCSEWVEIDATQTQLLVSGGFDQDAFEVAFGGVLTLWVAGLSIGLIISIIRKANKR